MKSEFEGGTSLRVNWFTLLRRGGENLLDNVSAETLKRKVPIYGGLAKGLYVYYCPTDVLVPSDLYSNDGLRKYGYTPPAQFYTHPMNDKFTIEYINGVRFIVVRHSEDEAVFVVDEMDSTIGKTTDVGMTLAENSFDFLSGSKALEAVFNEATYNKVGATFDTAEDITDFLRGVAIAPCNFESAKDIVSVEMRLLTSVGNYFSMISTSDSIGDNFIDGWNMVRFSIANRTSTGSPDETSIASWEIRVVTASGTSQTVILDRITLQKSAQHYFEYYSNRMFVDATTKAWKDEPEDNSDLINLNRDAMGVMHYECARLAIQSATFDKTDSQESKRFDNELARKYDQYFARHPSSEMPLSYNISPDIGREVNLDVSVATTEPLIIETDNSGIAFVSNQTPLGTINGINSAFSLEHAPNPADSLMLYYQGVLQIVGVDYTLSGLNITMTVPPSVNTYLTAFYRYTTA